MISDWKALIGLWRQILFNFDASYVGLIINLSFSASLFALTISQKHNSILKMQQQQSSHFDRVFSKLIQTVYTYSVCVSINICIFIMSMMIFMSFALGDTMHHWNVRIARENIRVRQSIEFYLSFFVLQKNGLRTFTNNFEFITMTFALSEYFIPNQQQFFT